MTDYYFITVNRDTGENTITIVRAKDEMQVADWWNSLPANDRPFCEFRYVPCEDFFQTTRGCLNPYDCINKCGRGIWLNYELDKEDKDVMDNINDSTLEEINNRIKREIPNIVSLLRNKRKEEYCFNYLEAYFLGNSKEECLESLREIFKDHRIRDFSELVLDQPDVIRCKIINIKLN